MKSGLMQLPQDDQQKFNFALNQLKIVIDKLVSPAELKKETPITESTDFKLFVQLLFRVPEEKIPPGVIDCWKKTKALLSESKVNLPNAPSNSVHLHGPSSWWQWLLALGGSGGALLVSSSQPGSHPPQQPLPSNSLHRFPPSGSGGYGAVSVSQMDYKNMVIGGAVLGGIALGGYVVFRYKKGKIKGNQEEKKPAGNNREIDPDSPIVARENEQILAQLRELYIITREQRILARSPLTESHPVDIEPGFQSGP